MTEFIQLSLVPLMIACLAAVTSALLGNFLVLRRQAMLGDAISHVALPGIVGAFLVTGTVSSWPMMAGATVAAVVAVVAIEGIRRFGRVEAGAATGVVLTAMFALGVVMLEQSDARSVHLDVEHALYGNLESLVWLAGEGWRSLLDPSALAELPPPLPRLAVVALATTTFVVVFWRPLTLMTFDEGFAETVGVPVRILSFALVVLVAVAAVAAFEAVGAIIVIALLICPAAAARLMTNRLDFQVAWSIVFALVSAVTGFLLASEGPRLFGSDNAVSAAGSIAVVSGVILAAMATWGPHRKRYGAAAGG